MFRLVDGGSLEPRSGPVSFTSSITCSDNDAAAEYISLQILAAKKHCDTLKRLESIKKQIGSGSQQRYKESL